MKVISNKLDLDQLTKMLKVIPYDEYDEAFQNDNYCQCDDNVQVLGECHCGFEDERGMRFSRYLSAIEAIAERLLSCHGLTMIKNEEKLTYRLWPLVSWAKAADCLRHTINGVGYFHFDTLKEFLSSGPYTARAATLNHLGWLKSYYAVYGDCDAQAQLDRNLR